MIAINNDNDEKGMLDNSELANKAGCLNECTFSFNRRQQKRTFVESQ
jgi:hypothetical protein